MGILFLTLTWLIQFLLLLCPSPAHQVISRVPCRNFRHGTCKLCAALPVNRNAAESAKPPPATRLEKLLQKEFQHPCYKWGNTCSDPSQCCYSLWWGRASGWLPHSNAQNRISQVQTVLPTHLPSVTVKETTHPPHSLAHKFLLTGRATAQEK